MSVECDGAADVYVTTHPKACKEHKCHACKATIPKGQRYTLTRIVYEGTAESVKRCVRCQFIHSHLVEKCRAFDSYMWPEERLNCGLSYESEWGAMPSFVQGLAFATLEELSDPDFVPSVLAYRCTRPEPMDVGYRYEQCSWGRIGWTNRYSPYLCTNMGTYNG